MDRPAYTRSEQLQLEIKHLERRADELARHAAIWLAGLGTTYTAEPGTAGAGILKKAVDAANERYAICAQLVELHNEADSLD